MNTKKFWCHYIGIDNNPKRRNIELTNLADFVPAIGDNEHCQTPLWCVREEDEYKQVRYFVYAQLSDNVAVKMVEAPCTLHFYELIMKTDDEIRVDKEAWLARYFAEYPKMSEERKAEEQERCNQHIAEDIRNRQRHLDFVKQLQNYTDILLNGAWVNASILKAYEEVRSPHLPVLQEMRRKGLAERERKNQERREKDRQRAEEEARKKAEAEAKEQERLTQEAEKFRQGESIAGEDVVELCRRYGIAVHLRTVHNLQQVIANINGKDLTCQYYRSRGKRRPVLDGCYKTAEELYQYLQKS